MQRYEAGSLGWKGERDEVVCFRTSVIAPRTKLIGKGNRLRLEIIVNIDSKAIDNRTTATHNRFDVCHDTGPRSRTTVKVRVSDMPFNRARTLGCVLSPRLAPCSPFSSFLPSSLVGGERSGRKVTPCWKLEGTRGRSYKKVFDQ
jgi:hypothetical protein